MINGIGLGIVLVSINHSDLGSSRVDVRDAQIQSELAAPFCYFSHPTDQIGFENSPNATVVTYDGAFLTPYGQLSFYAGSPGKLRPINCRVKTFLDGYLPLIEFQFDRDQLHYKFEAFATPIDLDPRKNLVTFIACEVSNRTHQPQAGVLGANFGEIRSKINLDPSWGGFLEQRNSLDSALGAQRSTHWHSSVFANVPQFSKPAPYQFQDGVGVKAGHLTFLANDHTGVSGMPSFPSTEKGSSVEYPFTLKPGTARSFHFKLPDVPIELLHEDQVRELNEIKPEDYRAKTVSFWKREVAKSDRFEVNDPKVMDTFKTSLVNDLIARELNEDGAVYQRVNRIQYNYMWIRDSSFFARTYDMVGRSDLAADTLRCFLVWQDGKPVGFFKPGSPQPQGARLSVQDDYWGQVLWAVGSHYQTTQDRGFLKQIYPLLSPHLEEFVAKCKTDSRGLWPVAGPYDNEAISGHYTGHSFWAILGLRYAVYLAKSMGNPLDVAAWNGILEKYQTHFLTQLRELTAHSGGYIPPGMDKIEDGNDWDNASGGLYPFEVLAPSDPLAKSTLQVVRDNNYQEGIMTYGGNAWVAQNLRREGKTIPGETMHHYETFYVTESNTVLGEQKKVIEDLYSILAHTGSTNSGFEFMIPPWSTRDPGDNFTPHGWFAARYMSQIRDMLVREAGDQLHLLSAVAPDWVKPGKEIRVTNAPTFFGLVSYHLIARNNGASVVFANRWKPKAKPASLVLDVPWFVTLKRASADGKPVRPISGQIVLPEDIQRVDLTWAKATQPNLSYREAVRLFLEKYYKPEMRGTGEFLFPASK